MDDLDIGMNWDLEDDPPMLPNPQMLLNIALIPHLSHLAFWRVDRFIDFFLPLLSTCKSLRVLVVLGQYVYTIIAHHKDKEKLARDERFVVMESKRTNESILGVHTESDVSKFHDLVFDDGSRDEEKRSGQDWILGAHTGIVYWSRAEEVVEKRRSGEINASEYTCGPKPHLE
ncbi:hypothetical protein MVEN_00887900 [Mycena venus]|uniref:Uncharacterized protein n=1 Tax=Mycena venus TaxID=2733690 RepID=A0A8H7D4E8_9AGAR|nr:hypothetical protein MVEN_00887900 [Mycena venus]